MPLLLSIVVDNRLYGVIIEEIEGDKNPEKKLYVRCIRQVDTSMSAVSVK